MRLGRERLERKGICGCAQTILLRRLSTDLEHWPVEIDDADRGVRHATGEVARLVD
jgi:hypothetical protein